jgi:hypothetical protein
MWSKAEGYCARFALILFETRKACGVTKGTEIDAASMRGAIQLTEYFKSHAAKVYATASIKTDDSRFCTFGHLVNAVSPGVRGGGRS